MTAHITNNVWTLGQKMMIGASAAFFAAAILEIAGVWEWIALKIYLWA